NSREMREGLAIGFHAVTFLQYAFAVFYDYTYMIVPHDVRSVHNAYGGKFKFLTFWDAILQTIFFLICLLNDLFGTNAINPKKSPFTRKLKDYFYASLGFPVVMFVGVTFWVLMFVDRELVLPKALDPYFPWWLNHLMHTMIMVTIMLETIFVPRQYPKRSRSLGILVSFMLTYLVWIHVIYYKSGIWVYPVMDVLTLPLRIVFFVVLLAFCVILYFVGETLNNIIWGNEYTKHKKSHAKSK
ncbi:AIG1 protein, partial [Acromyrmex charruanus]